ncbi:HlyD family secretion protein [Synechococcus sp. CBW1004]|uniref:HlyD family secretion protein n=1 Tax=Synechococcus sp. CBW1004 TaxID=1353136 RepID=UPI0018CDF57B|nr:HlyD family efflux transporter periplasmic adaptor subunit [Synechococcus sp. CBW1004]QPN62528.1 HlyD family efflux transporter periplasmic adaptor subunit [Synechococcus sp. CBW1004]
MSTKPPSLTPSKLVSRTQDSIEELIRNDENQGVLQQPVFWARAITWTLIGVAGFGIAWLAIAQTEEIVTVQGKLEPLGVVKDVQVPVGGVVDRILVKEGDRVEKGQALLLLDTEATRDRRAGIIKSISLKQQQLALKRVELDRFLDGNTTQQEVLAKNLALENDILQRLEFLSKEGAAGELQYLQQKNRVQDVNGRIEQTKADRLRQEAILNQEIKQLQAELSDLRNSLTELNVNIRYQKITSPDSGLIFELKPKAQGFVAQTSEPLMKVVPFDKLEARVEIPSKNIGFVSVGRPVDISIDSFPATDFGVLQGTVRSIGSDALPPDQVTQYPRYPADIRLNSQQLKLKDGTILPLQVGMSLTANIKLRKVTYLQLLLNQLQDKAKSLQQI